MLGTNPILQVAPIAVRDLFKRRAMNHDAGRIAATLVRIAQFGTGYTGARRRLQMDHMPVWDGTPYLKRLMASLGNFTGLLRSGQK